MNKVANENENTKHVVSNKIEALERRKRIKERQDAAIAKQRRLHDIDVHCGHKEHGKVDREGHHVCFCKMKPDPNFHIPVDAHSNALNKGILLLREEEQRLLNDRRKGQVSNYKDIPIDSNLQ